MAKRRSPTSSPSASASLWPTRLTAQFSREFRFVACRGGQGLTRDEVQCVPLLVRVDSIYSLKWGFGMKSMTALMVFGATSIVLAAAPSRAEPDAAVSLSATIFADFEASPTLDRTRPDLFGGSNVIFATGNVEENAADGFFHEIYQGVGESGTSLFDAAYSGDASIVSGMYSVDVFGQDQNNASASWWTIGGIASSYEWIEFAGPTDPSGNYVVTLTTNLGSFSAQNTQPPGFTYIWKANAQTSLVADPLEQGYASLQIGAFAFLKEDCPTMTQPPCFGTSRLTSATGDVTVPGSNPVLRLSHSVSLSGRSIDASVSRASMRISLPPGVRFSRYQQVPEPSALQLGFVALAAIGFRARMVRRDDLRA